MIADVGDPTLSSQRLSDADGKKHGRHFVFTVNFPSGTVYADCVAQCTALHNALTPRREVASYAFQLERAPTTMLLHIQGYIHTTQPHSFIMLHRILRIDGTHPWIAKARGTPTQAWDYCVKADTRVPNLAPFTKGDAPTSQGKRTDLTRFKEDLALHSSGDLTTADMIDQHQSVEARHFRYFHTAVERSIPLRSTVTQCVYLYGPPATGKSFMARQMARTVFGSVRPYTYIHRSSDSQSLWFDGYNNSDRRVIIIDEYRYGTLPPHIFNSMVDGNECLLPVKGGHIQCSAVAIIITSNYPPATVFDSADPATRESALSRLSCVWSVAYAPGFSLTDKKSRVVCAASAVWLRELPAPVATVRVPSDVIPVVSVAQS